MPRIESHSGRRKAKRTQGTAVVANNRRFFWLCERSFIRLRAMTLKRHNVVVVLFLASVVTLRGGTAQTVFSRTPTWIYEYFGFNGPGGGNTVLGGINNDDVI